MTKEFNSEHSVWTDALSMSLELDKLKLTYARVWEFARFVPYFAGR